MEGNTQVGTEAYVSPELLESKTIGHGCDIWAFGCLLQRMHTGKEAFSNDSDDEKENNLDNIRKVN